MRDQAEGLRHLRLRKRAGIGCEFRGIVLSAKLYPEMVRPTVQRFELETFKILVELNILIMASAEKFRVGVLGLRHVTLGQLHLDMYKQVTPSDTEAIAAADIKWHWL